LIVGLSVLVSALALYVVEWDGPDFEKAETFFGGLGISLYLSLTLSPRPATSNSAEFAQTGAGDRTSRVCARPLEQSRASVRTTR
jgi:hypothetical protein